MPSVWAAILSPWGFKGWEPEAKDGWAEMYKDLRPWCNPGATVPGWSADLQIFVHEEKKMTQLSHLITLCHGFYFYYFKRYSLCDFFFLRKISPELMSMPVFLYFICGTPATATAMVWQVVRRSAPRIRTSEPKAAEAELNCCATRWALACVIFHCCLSLWLCSSPLTWRLHFCLRDYLSDYDFIIHFIHYCFKGCPLLTMRYNACNIFYFPYFSTFSLKFSFGMCIFLASFLIFSNTFTGKPDLTSLRDITWHPAIKEKEISGSSITSTPLSLSNFCWLEHQCLGDGDMREWWRKTDSSLSGRSSCSR